MHTAASETLGHLWEWVKGLYKLSMTPRNKDISPTITRNWILAITSNNLKDDSSQSLRVRDQSVIALRSQSCGSWSRDIKQAKPDIWLTELWGKFMLFQVAMLVIICYSSNGRLVQRVYHSPGSGVNLWDTCCSRILQHWKLQKSGLRVMAKLTELSMIQTTCSSLCVTDLPPLP